RGSGLSIWATFARAVSEREADWNAEVDDTIRDATDYIDVVEDRDRRRWVYRLFHPMLAEMLRRLVARERSAETETEQRIVRQLVRKVPADLGEHVTNWSDAPSYVSKHLPEHIRRANLFEEFLGDASFLLNWPDSGSLLRASRSLTGASRRRLDVYLR